MESAVSWASVIPVLAALTAAAGYAADPPVSPPPAPEAAPPAGPCQPGAALASLLREYEIRPVPVQRSGPRGEVVGGTRPALAPVPELADLFEPYEPPTMDMGRRRAARPQTALEAEYREKVRQSPGSRRYYYQRAGLVRLIERAFGVDAARIYAPRWIAAKRYEVYFETKRPDCDYRLSLRRLLSREFGLVCRRETRPVETLVLRTPQGEPQRPPSRAPVCRTRRLFAAPSGSRSMSFTGCRTSDLVRFLERALHRPVIDETTARGRYDFELSWGVPVADLDALARRLRRKLGAELATEIRPVEVLLVEQVRALEKPVRYGGPGAAPE